MRSGGGGGHPAPSHSAAPHAPSRHAPRGQMPPHPIGYGAHAPPGWTPPQYAPQYVGAAPSSAPPMGGGSSHHGHAPQLPPPPEPTRTGEMNSVASLVERFVHNRRRRQSTIDAHLDEIEDALEQGDPLKFALWSLDQDAAFFEADGPAPRILEVTPSLHWPQTTSPSLALDRLSIAFHHLARLSSSRSPFLISIAFPHLARPHTEHPPLLPLPPPGARA